MPVGVGVEGLHEQGRVGSIYGSEWTAHEQGRVGSIYGPEWAAWRSRALLTVAMSRVLHPPWMPVLSGGGACGLQAITWAWHMGMSHGHVGSKL